MRSLRPLVSIILLALAALAAHSAETGSLHLDVMGEIGAGATNPARVIAADGHEAGQVKAGASIALPPGNYKLVLPIIGGQMTKDDVTIESGRTHTVLIDNVAVMEVSVKDRSGKDPGFGVTVTGADAPHAKIASFLTGEKILFAPAQVNVHVDAPPQGYDWHAVTLTPGHRARLTLDEVVPAELLVKTQMALQPSDGSTRVVILRPGTQSQVAASDPGAEHRFKLDPGDYDIYVENQSGKGKPYASVAGVHLDSGAKVERTVPMD